jgi:hypothetical protein
VILSVVAGKLGSVAGWCADDTIRHATIPSTAAGFAGLVKSWLRGSDDVLNVMYFDDFYMLNSARLEESRIDIAEYAYRNGVFKGIGYALMDYVTPCDTRELLLQDLGIVDQYDVGSSMEALAFDVAAKSFPEVKESIEDDGGMFFTVAPALALLSKVVKHRTLMPTVYECTKVGLFPDTHIFI